MGVPLRLYGVGGRYATALYQAAAASKATSAVEKELSVIGGAIAESPKFAAFLENPFIDGDEKLAVLAPALDSASPLTKNFFGVLAEGNRLSSTAEIIALKKDLETNYLAKGETLELTTEVDSSI